MHGSGSARPTEGDVTSGSLTGGRPTPPDGHDSWIVPAEDLEQAAGLFDLLMSPSPQLVIDP